MTGEGSGEFADAVAAYLERSRRRAGERALALEQDVLARELDEALELLSVSEAELRVQDEAIHAAARITELERQRYQALFDSAPEAYVVSDANGLIREANRAASALFEIPPALLIGKPLAVYLPPEEKRTFHSRLLGLSRLERIRDWDLGIAQRDGGVVPVSISAAGLVDPATNDLEIRWLLRDQTERRRAEESQRHLQQEHAARVASEQAERRALFLANASRAFATANSPDEILQLTASLAAPFLGSFCLVDRQVDGHVVRVAAHHADEAHRDSFAQFDPQETVGIAADAVARVIGSGQPEVIVRAETRERGYDDPVEHILDALGTRLVLIVPLRGHSDVLGAVTIGRNAHTEPDVNPIVVARSYAERAALALEHALLVQELEVSRRAAEDANRAKADFLAAISHEIRTPLTAALGYTELLLDGVPDPLPEGAAAFARGIQASIHHQIAIVEELLLFARVEAGAEQVRPEPTDVCRVIDEVALLVRPDASAAGLDLVVDVPEHEIAITTDSAKLRQILLNLSANALRYTERGAIRLRASDEGDRVRIEVVDTGIGISPDDLDKVFDRFWRGETFAGRQGGIGLGLTISRHLAHLLGGEVSIRSELGSGTTFTVVLPRKPEVEGA